MREEVRQVLCQVMQAVLDGGGHLEAITRRHAYGQRSLKLEIEINRQRTHEGCREATPKVVLRVFDRRTAADAARKGWQGQEVSGGHARALPAEPLSNRP